jgi:EmrB/QacA subfamily drug resistance transporter
MARAPQAVGSAPPVVHDGLPPDHPGCGQAAGDVVRGAGRVRRPGRRGAVLAVLCVSLLIVSLDSTVLNVALPTISQRLHASGTQLQWIVDAYAIVFAGMLLTLGSIGDRVGRRRVFRACLALFAAGSAASAFSGSAGLLIAARASMGAGAAGIMPCTLSILTNVFDDDVSRARAIGIWSGTTGVGISVGPIVGGWLLAHYWWGSVFLVNVPICAAGLLATYFVVPESRDPAADRPDPVGALLSVASLASLLWGIIEAPQYGWTSPTVLASLFAGLALLGAFAVYERRCSHPMLDLSLFSNRRFSVAMSSMGLVMFALMGALFLLTQYLQFSLGLSPLQTGVRIAPVALVILVVAPSSSLIVRRLGTKVVVTAGMVTIGAGMLLLAGTSPAGSYADALPALLLLGGGTGLAFAPCTESVMGSLAPDRAGIGAATNGAALQVGGALGVGVLGSILTSRYQGHLTPLLAHEPVPASVLHVITGTLGGALGVARAVGGVLGAELATAARSGFVDGMDLAVTVGGIVAMVGAATALAMLPARARSRSGGAGPPARRATTDGSADRSKTAEE